MGLDATGKINGCRSYLPWWVLNYQPPSPMPMSLLEVPLENGEKTVGHKISTSVLVFNQITALTLASRCVALNSIVVPKTNIFVLNQDSVSLLLTLSKQRLSWAAE